MTITIFKMTPDHCFVQSVHVATVKDLRMSPCIEFAILDADAVWCLREIIAYPHVQVFFFSNVVSSTCSH